MNIFIAIRGFDRFGFGNFSGLLLVGTGLILVLEEVFLELDFGSYWIVWSFDSGEIGSRLCI